jgi:DNA-binding transcriptional MerR regulator/methylmalonyl-CoA mutase cobalamin-binding subunit
MYTIGEASARSGVSVPLLRAWQRRYGIVTPARTAAGYRLYDETAVAMLRRMRTLVDSGWSPAQAAEALRSGQPIAQADPREAPGVIGADALVEAIVNAARDLDAGALDRALDDALLLADLGRSLETIIMPALVAIGEGWADGRVDVAGEHLVSHAVLRRLAQAFEGAAVGDTRPLVLVGLPPTSRHEVGALAFATVARRAGLGAVYLGADTPVESWRQAVADVRPDAVVLGLAVDADVLSARDVAAAVHPTPVFVGGAPASRLGDAEPMTALDGLVASVERLRSELRRRRAGPREPNRGVESLPRHPSRRGR